MPVVDGLELREVGLVATDRLHQGQVVTLRYEHSQASETGHRAQQPILEVIRPIGDSTLLDGHAKPRSLMATPKQVAREVLDSLPEDCSLEDIAYHLYVRAQVEEGVRDLDEGRAVPHEQVMREAADWLRKR